MKEKFRLEQQNSSINGSKNANKIMNNALMEKLESSKLKRITSILQIYYSIVMEHNECQL